MPRPNNPLLFDTDSATPARRIDTEITLRDLFAAAALAGLGEPAWSHAGNEAERDYVAGICYRQADAMLAAREGK